MQPSHSTSSVSLCEPSLHRSAERPCFHPTERVCSSFVFQSSRRSSGWTLTSLKPQTRAFPWSSLPWFGPTRQPPSPLWTSWASLWPTPQTCSRWTHRGTPGWTTTLWGSDSAACQGTSHWTPATAWEQCRATSLWQVSSPWEHMLKRSAWSPDL